MTENDERVIDLTARSKKRKRGGNRQCPECGGEWFLAQVVLADEKDDVPRVTGVALDAACAHCGEGIKV